MKTWGDRYYALRGYVLILLLVPLVAARLQSNSPLVEGWLLLVLGGMLLRLWAGAHIGNHSNGTVLAAGPRARTGPYRFLRHPLYVSNLAVAAGLIGFSNGLAPVMGLLIWALCVAHHLILVVLENSLSHSQADPALPAGWKTTFRRQGRNTVYTLACVGLLMVVSQFSLALFP